MKPLGMTNTEFLPDAVQWSEGMLLSPQHFQQNDIHLQALLHQRLAALAPHGWGLRHLRLDTTRLAKGYVKVTECDAVMSDGVPIVFRAFDDARSLNIDVDAACAVDGTPVRVLLAIPPRAGAMDVHSTSIRRYEPVSGRATLDETVGTGDVVVDRQRVKLSLHIEDELPSGYPAVPLLEVRRNANGNIELTTYHPPGFRLDAFAFLGRIGLESRLLELRNVLWDKLRQIVGLTTEDSPDSVAALGSEARSHLRVAREIAACLPLADTVLADPAASPAQAWSALVQIVGRMTAIGSDPRPPALDPYRHDDCQPQFQAALSFVERKLSLVRTSWDSMAFERLGEGAFSRRLPEAIPGELLVELRPADGQTAASMLAWLQQARIGSEDLLPVLRQRRLPGAEIRVLNSNEIASLGLRPEAMLFGLSPQTISVAEGETGTFRAGRSLVVQGDTGHGPAAIILHRHRDAAERGGNGHA